MVEESSDSNTFCAKQPIFNAGQKIWGYAFLYRHGPQDRTTAPAKADTDALRESAESLENATGQSRVRFCTTFTPGAVLEGMPYVLPPALTVIGLPAGTQPTDALLERLRALRRAGFTFALDTVPHTRPAPELARLAHVLLVDFSKTPEQDYESLLQASRTQLLATHVKTPGDFNKARQAGFSLFHGDFFRSPASQSGRTLTSMENSRLRLVRILRSPEPDFGALGEVVKADVTLTYRLLSLLNSPAFGLVRRIESVGQALVLLGWQQLKNWLFVVILSDLMPSGKSPELIILSAQRAKFFELAAEQTDAASGSFFLLGLFSLLEPLMGMPMRTLVTDLPLEAPLKDALCGEKNAYTNWLDLAESFEALDWERIMALLDALGLNAEQAARAYHAATLWANTLLTLL